jgi:hypothetical protein
MKLFFVLACLMVAAPAAQAADYDKTEKTAFCEIRLRIPSSAMAIAPLRDMMMARYNADASTARKEAREDKESNPSFQPYVIDINWRITFENDAVISLSADTYANTGAAHPNDAFQTLVWDKRAARAVPISALFEPAKTNAALAAIAAAASKAWTKVYMQRSGHKPGPGADLAKDGIGPDAERLKNYALTYAKGETTANGIVLLYGAGQVWPHVLGDFRLAVPATVFAKYLAPQWRSMFT